MFFCLRNKKYNTMNLDFFFARICLDFSATNGSRQSSCCHTGMENCMASRSQSHKHFCGRSQYILSISLLVLSRCSSFLLTVKTRSDANWKLVDSLHKLVKKKLPVQGEDLLYSKGPSLDDRGNIKKDGYSKLEAISDWSSYWVLTLLPWTRS